MNTSPPGGAAPAAGEPEPGGHAGCTLPVSVYTCAFLRCAHATSNHYTDHREGENNYSRQCRVSNNSC